MTFNPAQARRERHEMHERTRRPLSVYRYRQPIGTVRYDAAAKGWVAYADDGGFVSGPHRRILPAELALVDQAKR